MIRTSEPWRGREVAVTETLSCRDKDDCNNPQEAQRLSSSGSWGQVRRCDAELRRAHSHHQPVLGSLLANLKHLSWEPSPPTFCQRCIPTIHPLVKRSWEDQSTGSQGSVYGRRIGSQSCQDERRPRYPRPKGSSASHRREPSPPKKSQSHPRPPSPSTPLCSVQAST